MDISRQHFLRLWIKAECRRHLGTIRFDQDPVICKLVDKYGPRFIGLKDAEWSALEYQIQWFRSGMLRNLLDLPELRFFISQAPVHVIGEQFLDCWCNPSDSLATFALKNPDYGNQRPDDPPPVDCVLLAVHDPVLRYTFLIEGYSRACALIRRAPPTLKVKVCFVVSPFVYRWERFCPPSKDEELAPSAPAESAPSAPTDEEEPESLTPAYEDSSDDELLAPSAPESDDELLLVPETPVEEELLPPKAAVSD